jgi:hypothetical protein
LARSETKLQSFELLDELSISQSRSGIMRRGFLLVILLLMVLNVAAINVPAAHAACTVAQWADTPLACAGAANVSQTSCTVGEWAGTPVKCANEVFNATAKKPGSPIDLQALSIGGMGATFKSPSGGVKPQVYANGAAAAAGNPYNCWGQTDLPHKSSGDASVHARTYCSVRLPFMYVDVDLYRDRWYGLQWLDQDDSAWVYAKSSSRYQVEANARWHCVGAGTYTYRAYSYHEVRDPGGNRYYADTGNSNRFTC